MLIDKTSKAIRSMWVLALVPLGILLVALRGGVWLMPNLGDQYLVSQSLLKNPFQDPMAQYIFNNYLEPLIFHLIGGHGIGNYFIFCLIISVLFIAVFCAWFIVYHGKNIALLDGKLLGALTFPVFFIPLYWVGMDGMTLLLMLLVLVSFGRKVSVIPAFLLGLQHFQQGLAGFLVLLGTVVVAWAARKDEGAHMKDDIKSIGLIIIALVISKLALHGWFRLNGIVLTGSRSSYMRVYVDSYFHGWISSWAAIAWTLFGTSWVLVILKLKRLWPLLVGTLVVFLFLAVIGDKTRVGTIILFPSLFYWIFMDRKLQLELRHWHVYALVLLFAVLPVTVVWGPVLHSLAKYDAVEYRAWRAGEFNFSDVDAMMPFTQSSKYNLALVYSPKALHTTRGTVEHGELASDPGDGPGILSFGPYASLPAGRYRATIRYRSGTGTLQAIGWVDVTVKAGTDELAKTILRGTNGVDSYVDVTFRLPVRSNGVEVRTWVNGQSSVSISGLEIMKLAK